MNTRRSREPEEGDLSWLLKALTHNPTPEEVEAYWASDEAADNLSESIVAAVEKLEASSLGDSLGPRARGGLGFVSHLRSFYAKAFERVYAKRRSGEHDRP